MKNKKTKEPKPTDAYARATIRAIKAEVRRKFKDAREILHIQPRAYCVAKPARWCAVFATPPCDSELLSAYKESCLIQNASVAHVQLGDWCSLAYICSSSGCGESMVIFNLSDKNGTRTN